MRLPAGLAGMRPGWEDPDCTRGPAPPDGVTFGAAGGCGQGDGAATGGEAMISRRCRALGRILLSAGW